MPKKIIIIDDESSILEIYSQKFSTQANWQILTAKNGKEGLELIKQHQPNLILLDIVMPKADGFDVLQKIKKDETLKNIPVIMLTNLTDEEDKAEAFKRGALDYLVKAEHTPSQALEAVKRKLKV
ncbi:response regulator [bacterium (Candidatus Gribaldobacteria) CG08_land_8_20_14_0_20_39_15]|uniref:Response regulator n=1 Tax=bacterium (Candidatus Gribaldobacteria) CG08_land_8_20_14_0_20_39_15 TaxID=2014273 RepID=A0A2M6XU31_9BACT|nr:MAG: response regulator [bacterium (Candidatus Gribaldobacteria) CG08_land_8_20_14_0_20_39_15]